MAMDVVVPLENQEFRAIQTGVSQKTGKTWMSIIVEDFEARQTSVSVPAELQNEVTSLGLRKGELLKLAVRIKAGNDYAYTQYQGLEKREPFAQYPQYGTNPADALGFDPDEF